MISISIAKSNRCNGDYSLYVTFEFDNRILGVIRSFPTKFWDAENKIWEIPFNKLGELVSKCSWSDFDITGQYITVAKPEAKVPKGFKFKTKPYEHQIDGFNFGLQYDRWLLGDEMGLGKTKQVIDIAVAKKLAKNYQHCLIICGVNGLKWNWQNEVNIHSDESAYILGQRIQRGKVVIGSNKDKYTDAMTLATNPNYFIITNVESLRDEAIAEQLQKLCKDGVIGMIAFDEAHKCFDYDTLIQTDIGQLKIGEIVTKNIHCSILSYNETTGQQEWKAISNWFENRVNEQLVELEFKTKQGIKKIKCTEGHKFLTKNRGWVQAIDLTSYDEIEEI